MHICQKLNINFKAVFRLVRNFIRIIQKQPVDLPESAMEILKVACRFFKSCMGICPKVNLNLIQAKFVFIIGG